MNVHYYVATDGFDLHFSKPFGIDPDDNILVAFLKKIDYRDRDGWDCFTAELNTGTLEMMSLPGKPASEWDDVMRRLGEGEQQQEGADV